MIDYIISRTLGANSGANTLSSLLEIPFGPTALFVYGFDQQRLMFFACGIWCIADVSNVSPSSEQSAEKLKQKNDKKTVKKRLCQKLGVLEVVLTIHLK